MAADKIKRYHTRWEALKSERQSWVDDWTDISELILPRTGRFLTDETNRGDKRRFNEIYDSTATWALSVLAAGMMAGMTSPARPWFRLATPDSDLMESAAVKSWLHDVASTMRDVFARSNTYRALHSQYEELALYGTAANLLVADFDSVVRHYPLTAGEYAIATDHRGVVSTVYREFKSTVAQMVGEFSYEKCSAAVRGMYDRGDYDKWITIIHAMEPRYERDTRKRDSLNMPWKSCYFEQGGDQDSVLRESGFKSLPAVVPRWSTSGGDIYGVGPGGVTLGDVRQLQHQQLRKAEVIDFQTKPPMQAPTQYKNSALDLLPGGVSFVDAATPQGGLRPAFDVRLDLQHLLLDIQDVRARIGKNFYADLFLMMASDSRSNVTAREVAERHEEKLIMLGPVLERLHDELLSPLIDITFDHMVDAHLIPPPPPEMEGMELKVEFVSMLAQAQRAVGVTSIDRLLGTVSAAAQFKPEMLDKLDGDQIVDSYADMLGVDPELIVADEQVAIVRQQRAAQQQAMQQAEMIPAGAKAAKDLSQADTSGQNALTDLTRMFSGYGATQ